ncbi:hypothetical protein FB45DRAFT_1067562 [Roridomyces roridus]|uniref:Amidohydrolase-related domain-containing protein n=1 Tax=Roridomyces roridus TaxID=1738132 RepID=A0AAD7B2S0_9AGAR|nr:hypothetical protein FB45DRAFT_1067562 [Roridomyces roridus]
MSSPSSILLSNGTVLVHNQDEHVVPVKADVLVVGNRIAEIAPGVAAPPDAVVVDCTGKIISPGFVDTHHHMWQTQLKGRHADDLLLDYIHKGNITYDVFNPEDVFWGQLGGCMESLDGGVTMVVDHAHINSSAAHSASALSATEASGIRSYFCYSPIQNPHTASWSPYQFAPPDLSDPGLIPAWALKQLAELAAKQPFGDGRVRLGVSWDAFYLPKEIVVPFFHNARNLGVKLFTSHYVKNAIVGEHSVVSIADSYGVLKHDILFSHASQATSEDAALLTATNSHVSSTPDTELQMAHGTPVCFRPDLYQLSSLGVDCHSNNSGDILTQMRLALQSARGTRNALFVAQKKVPRVVQPTVEQAFNLGTIMGARAVGLGNEIGSIKVGKLADLVVFDARSPSMICAGEHEPVAAIVMHASVRDIETVIVDGKIRKQDGKLVPVDVGEGAEKQVLEWAGIAEKLIQSRDRIQGVLEGMDDVGARAAVIQTFGINSNNVVDSV